MSLRFIRLLKNPRSGRKLLRDGASRLLSMRLLR